MGTGLIGLAEIGHFSLRPRACFCAGHGDLAAYWRSNRQWRDAARRPDGGGAADRTGAACFHHADHRLPAFRFLGRACGFTFTFAETAAV